MITFFTVPKPFEGHTGIIQRNAIASWLRLDPQVQVLLIGDDPGVAEAARDLGVEHEPSLTREASGTPRLDSAFAAARRHARRPLLCFANADVMLLDDFARAARSVAASSTSFLMIGESWDTEVTEQVDDWDSVTRLPGRKRGAGALDWFLFTPDIFGELPPFLIGRAKFDNWLVWRACADGATVVDATRSVHALHQRHDYAHVAGGYDATRLGDEARRNALLAGSKDHLYTRFDATHVLTRGRLRRNFGATLRAKERGRKLAYKLRRRSLRRASFP